MLLMLGVIKDDRVVCFLVLNRLSREYSSVHGIGGVTCDVSLKGILLLFS